MRIRKQKRLTMFACRCQPDAREECEEIRAKARKILNPDKEIADGDLLSHIVMTMGWRYDHDLSFVADQWMAASAQDQHNQDEGVFVQCDDALDGACLALLHLHERYGDARLEPEPE